MAVARLEKLKQNGCHSKTHAPVDVHMRRGPACSTAGLYPRLRDIGYPRFKCCPVRIALDGRHNG